MQMDCDLGQGYLFAQPMAEDRFLALLRQRAERPARQPAPGVGR
jgi:EAL domain-containing protein (putative c-di-GMP-specific phosphodiesterase class I)